jgi:hypothetical protein
LSNKVNIGIDGYQRATSQDLEISQNVAEVFSTPAGEAVKKYLRSITIEMVHGPNVNSEELRHHEGQRFIVGIIEARINHAHRSKNK